MPFDPATFTAVLALDVLEHVDDVGTLGEIRRVLRRGGVLIATVPAIPALWTTRDEEAGHRRRYTRAALGARLESAGFDIQTMRYYQFFLLPVLAASRLAARAGIRTQRSEEEVSRPVQRLFAWITDAELRLGRRIAWPLGSTLAVAAAKSKG